jgi:uncharacterized YokU family protein
MKCVWCDQEGAKETVQDFTWIEPEGKEYIVVQEVPAVDCPTCNDVYLEDSMTEEVEEAINSVNLEKMGLTFTYEKLMSAPRVSIFDLYKQSKPE